MEVHHADEGQQIEVRARRRRMGIHEHDDRLGAEENAGDHQQAEVLPGGHQVAVATSDGAEQQAQVAQDDEGGAG